MNNFRSKMSSVTQLVPGGPGAGGKEVEDRLIIKPPDEFQFPFPPYSIQVEFMNALFNTLNKGWYILYKRSK